MFEIKHVASSKQLREAYDTLYHHNWLGPRASLGLEILRMLKARPGLFLLDVGCGDAQVAMWARKIGLIYYGVDISFNALQIAQQPGLIVGDGSRLPFPDCTFDYLINIGSLEHYWDLTSGVREMARVLKIRGLACILVPNAFSLTWNILRVWRTGDLADDDGQPIQRFGTRSAWHKLLEANGLKVIQVLGYERPLPRTTAERLLYISHPKEALLALLAPLVPANLKRSFIFLCTR